MCAANRKIIWLDTEYSTNWDIHIMYMYVYKFDVRVHILTVDDAGV